MRTVNAYGKNMYAWYDLRTFDMPEDNKITADFLDQNFSQFDIKESIATVLDLIKTEVDVL